MARRDDRASSRSGLAAAAAVAALVCGGPVLFLGAVAQTPSGPSPRWPSTSAIAVWIDSADAPDGGATLVARALDLWTRAAAGQLRLHRTADLYAAAIRVRFMKSGTLYGETVPRLDLRSRVITSADVYVAADTRGDALATQIVVYLTALHELGHAIGVAHTDRFDDIMYRFRAPEDGARYFARYRALVRHAGDIGTTRALGLSAGDVGTLRALYAP